MERKTIGSFIAALRKANGMTQRDLADRLNVSDKTVSRWEQDNGAPDLSLIPVIAEIFDVSCDELLRGERKSPEQRTEPAVDLEISPKAEKQRQRLLTSALSTYRFLNFISMGISVAGLLAAMICNLGFLRAVIGFLVGSVFYLAAVVCQAIFINSALMSVSDDSLSPSEMIRFRSSVIRLAQKSIGLTVVLFAASLPLILFSGSAYVGLSARSWLIYGPVFGALALVILSVVLWLFNNSMAKKGHLLLSERNHRLKRNCALVAAAALLVTLITQAAVTARWNAYDLSKGTEFYDYESFAEFMELDVPYADYQTSWNGTVSVPNAPVAEEPTNYYDQHGNDVSEDEALRRELALTDGTVVCTYLMRNRSVAHIRYGEKDGSLLPITVITYHELQDGLVKYRLISGVFVALYCLEAAAGFFFYFRKRAK